MKVRVVSAGQRKRVVPSQKKAQQTEKTLLDQVAQVVATRRTAMKQGLSQAGQEDRTARVEALRAQVRAGTYQVDSRALAERLLSINYQAGYDNLE